MAAQLFVYSHTLCHFDSK